MRISIAEATVGKTSLTFNFSDHFRGETTNPLDIDGDVVIDLDGNLITKSSSLPRSLNIVIIGGIDSHIYRKDPGTGPDFYMNRKQIETLVSLVQNYGMVMKFDGKITDGDNTELNNMVHNLFLNGRS